MGGIGGGTFEEYNKVVPGIYFKEETLSTVIDSNGIVAFLYPGMTKLEENLVTKSTYSSFIDTLGGDGGMTKEDLKKFVKEILLNAIGVHMIPLKVTAAAATNENQYSDSSNDIEGKLSDKSFDVLVVVDSIDKDLSNVVKGVEQILTKSNKRFITVLRSGSANSQTVWDYFNDKPALAKWFLCLHHNTEAYDKNKCGEFFLAGAYSVLQLGNGLSGFQYNGEDTASIGDSVPSTMESVETSVKSGFITFYNYGSQYFVLKDITYAYSNKVTNAPAGYKRGEYVRLEKYFYNYLTSLYSTVIQGKPNSEERRSIIQSIILEELYRLQSIEVIENVQPGNVSVTKPTVDSILISLSYQPIASIEIIYIKYQVEV